MPLQLPDVPANAYAIITAAISRLSLAEGGASTVTKVADPSKLNVALPHKVFTLGSDDIARGRNLSRAQLVAWRFLIQDGSRTIAAIELACDVAGGNVRFASVDTGPFAQETRNVVQHAERLDAVKQGSYELRVLKAPSVYAMAAWLKNLTGPDDIVIPIDPDHPVAVNSAANAPAIAGGASQLAAGASPAQGAAGFLAGLQPTAKTALGFDSTPPSKPGSSR